MKGFIIFCNVLSGLIAIVWVTIFTPVLAAFLAALFLGCVIVALWRAFVLKKY